MEMLNCIYIFVNSEYEILEEFCYIHDRNKQGFFQHMEFRSKQCLYTSEIKPDIYYAFLNDCHFWLKKSLFIFLEGIQSR